MNKTMSGDFMIMEYPYLLIVCALMLLFAIGLVLCPRERRMPMILSALISTPFSLASFFFDPSYWHPDRIIGNRIGIEDMLFSFATGGLAWLFAIWPSREKIGLNLKATDMLIRMATISVSGLFMYLVLRYAGFSVMTSVLLIAAVCTIVLMFVINTFKSVFFMGILSFSLFYLLFVKGCFLIFPNLINLWNVPSLWGYFPWGIPLEELAWAALFGGAWPVIMLYVFGVKPNIEMDRICYERVTEFSM